MASLRDARFPALVAGSVLVAWHPLLELFRLALHSDEYTHILLVLPISIALISVQWRSERLLTRTSLFAGGSFLSAALVIAAFSRWGLASLSPGFHLMMAILAVVIWWIGSFVLCFGTKVSRAMLLPIGFLFWMVPPPAVALNEIIKFLQYGSARATDALFALAGVPVAQDGLLTHHSWSYSRNRQRVQQHSIQPNAGGYNHGASVSVAALAVEAAPGCRHLTAIVDREKWIAYFYHRDAGDQSRPGIFEWQVSSSGRRGIFCDFSADYLPRVVGTAARREAGRGEPEFEDRLAMLIKRSAQLR